MANEHRALTDIKGGTVKGQKQVPTVVPDVEHTHVREGEVVDKSDYTEEEWAQMVASGTVTDDPKDLVRPKNYKASSVQAAAHEEQVAARGNELPEPQDDTNPELAQSTADTNKQANQTARKVREAEREFDEKLATDPDFRASLLEGFANQPRQHQSILHAAKQDFVTEKVYGDAPKAVPGRKASVTRTEGAPKNDESQTKKGGDK